MMKSAVKTVSEIGKDFVFAPFQPMIQPIINEVLKEHQKDKFRKGTILTPCVLVWLCFALVLRRNLNCKKVLDWLFSGFRWELLNFTNHIVKDGTISHARLKMGVDVFRDIFNRFVSTFKDKATPDFYGWVTVMFDGVSMTTPDTKSNLERFGKHQSGRGQSGFPQIRMVALMMLFGRRIIDLDHAPCKGKKTGERTLMFKILKRCSKTNFLYLFDAGFYSFRLADYMAENGLQSILKIAKSVKVKAIPGSRMADGSYLAVLKGKVVESVDSDTGRIKWEKKEIVVRVIDFCIPGFRPVRLITSLLDPAISAKEIVIHYHKRWDIEIAFDELKTHQCATLTGQLPTIFRSKRDELVEQELYAMLTVYNLIRSLIKEATDEAGGDPLIISFSGTLDVIIECAPLMSTVKTDRRKKMWTFLLQVIAELEIDRPRRPRRNPRTVKVKMSNFNQKRANDKSEYVNFAQDVDILLQKAT